MRYEVWFSVVMGAFVIGAPQAVTADDPTGVYGAWDLTLETRSGDRSSWVKLFKEGDLAVAEFVGTGGGKNRATKVTVNGDTFQWTMGQSTYHVTLADGHVDLLPKIGAQRDCIDIVEDRVTPKLGHQLRVDHASDNGTVISSVRDEYLRHK